MAITLKDIAQRAKVSQMTVSRILNGKAEGQVSAEVVTRVKAVISELKYQPNKISAKLEKIVQNKAEEASIPSVKMLVPYPGSLHFRINDLDLSTEIFEGAMEAAAKMNGQLEIVPIAENKTNSSNPFSIKWEWLNKIPTGSRILAYSPWFITPLLELDRRGCRIALIQGEEFWHDLFKKDTTNWALFTFQNCDGFRQLTNYLISQGCKRIASIAFAPYIHEPDYPRVKGYETALYGTNNKYRNIIEVDDSDNIREVVSEAYSKNPFDGLIFNSPQSTVWDYSISLHANLSLPERVKIVSIGNNLDLIYPHHNISTMRFPMRQIGFDAVTALFADHFSNDEKFYKGSILERK